MTHYEDDCPDDGDGHVWEDEGDAPVAEDAVEAAEEALESVSRRFDFLPLNGEEILTLNADTEQFEIKSASGERLYKLPLEGIDNFYYEATVRLYRQKGAEMVIQIHEEGNGRCNHEGGSMTREVVLKIQTEQGDATFDAIYTSALYTAEKYTTVSSTSESGEDMTRRIELPHGALEVETALESKMIHEDYAGHCADGTKSGRESGCTCAGRDYSHFEENTVWTFFFNASAGGPDGKTKWELETEKQRTPKDVWCKCCEQSDEVE